MLKIVYSFFLGILLAILVGVGVQAFYPQPEAPTYPTELNMIGKDGPTTEQQQLQKDFDAKQSVWNEQMKPYNRNVSIITMVAALIFVTVGLLLESRIGVLANGLVLGGVFTLLYSMGRGFASANSKYSFVVALTGVIVVTVLGYLRFIRPGHQELVDSRS